MRRVTPIHPLKDRRVEGGLRFPQNRNIWLRRILAWLQKLRCIETCSGEIVTLTRTVTTEKIAIRVPDEMALATVVVNHGGASITAWEEDGEQVIIPAESGRAMTGRGYGRIFAQAASGSVVVTVSTYRRCECGHAVTEQPGEPTIPEPGTTTPAPSATTTTDAPTTTSPAPTTTTSPGPTTTPSPTTTTATPTTTIAPTTTPGPTTTVPPTTTSTPPPSTTTTTSTPPPTTTTTPAPTTTPPPTTTVAPTTTTAPPTTTTTAAPTTTTVMPTTTPGPTTTTVAPTTTTPHP